MNKKDEASVVLRKTVPVPVPHIAGRMVMIYSSKVDCILFSITLHLCSVHLWSVAPTAFTITYDIDKQPLVIEDVP